jgi:aminoglycoside phosphotransferase (APT) family kinase protein
MPMSLDGLAHTFNTSDQGSVNIRSKTALVRFDDRDVHLKTSEIDLSVEAAALLDGATLGQPDGVRSVSLVAFDADRNVLITEHAEGESFFNVLWNSTSIWTLNGGVDARGCHSAAERIARWLRAFHALSAQRGAAGGPGSDECVSTIVDSALGKLESLERSGHSPLRRHELEGVRRFIVNTASSPDWASLPVRRIHGDFCHVNMLMRQDGVISVLDFADCRWGFALEDYVRLWCSIWEIAETGRRRRRALEPALVRMLAAAQLDSHVTQTAPFLLLRTWNAITKMLESVPKATTLPLGTRLLVRRLARAHARWLIAATTTA